jgi:hypothetical protein
MIGALLGVWAFQFCSALSLAPEGTRLPILGIVLLVQFLALLVISSLLSGLMLLVRRLRSSWREWSFRSCLSWSFLVLSVSSCLPLPYALLKQPTLDLSLDAEGHPVMLSHRRLTEHFDLRSDSEIKLDYYAKVFEGFYSYFNDNWFPVSWKEPLVIYLFHETYAYIMFNQKVGGPETPYGYYLTGQNRLVINAASGLGTATHELVHHFIFTAFSEEDTERRLSSVGSSTLDSNTGRIPSPPFPEPPLALLQCPSWLNEGFAAFFEKFIGHLEGDSLVLSVGYFSNWRDPDVQRRVDGLSLDSLFRFEDGDQSAARSFVLFLHRQGWLKPFMNEMIHRDQHLSGASTLDRDLSGATTLELVTGKTTIELEEAWKDWIRSQPNDDNVQLVPQAFIKNDDEWREWWTENRGRLAWDSRLGIYVVRDAQPLGEGRAR